MVAPPLSRQQRGHRSAGPPVGRGKDGGLGAGWGRAGGGPSRRRSPPTTRGAGPGTAAGRGGGVSPAGVLAGSWGVGSPPRGPRTRKGNLSLSAAQGDGWRGSLPRGLEVGEDVSPFGSPEREVGGIPSSEVAGRVEGVSPTPTLGAALPAPRAVPSPRRGPHRGRGGGGWGELLPPQLWAGATFLLLLF